MNTQTKNLLYKKAIAKWGNQFQIIMILEEMAELQKALIKLMRADEGPISDVLEEVADLEIMLEQLRHILIVDEEEINLIKERKLLRLKKILE